MIRLVVVAALVGAGFGLRAYQIGGQEFWIDEALSFHRATTAGGLRPDVVIDPSPPLYYFLLRLWIPFAGSDEAGLRLLSAIFGALFVLVTVWAGRELFNTRVGMWSGIFAAIAPIHIYYSQEARPYALLMTLLMLTLVLLRRALRNGSATSWALVTATTLLALFTHYFATLALIPAVGLAFVGTNHDKVSRNLMQLGKIMVVCAVVFIPWIYWAYMMTPHSEAEVTWIKPWWQETPPALVIPRTLEVLSLGGHDQLASGAMVKIIPQLHVAPALRLLGMFAFLILGVLAAVPWLDDRLGVTHLRQLKIWLGGMLFVPLLLLWMLSLYRPVYLVGRYDLIAFPAFTLIVGLGLAKAQAMAQTRWLPLGLAIVLGCVLSIGTRLVDYYAVASVRLPPSPVASAEALASLAKTGDVVVFTGLRGMPVLYYLHRLGFSWIGGECIEVKSGRRFGCRMFPKEIEQSPATYDTARVLASSEAVQDDVQHILAARSEPDRVLWLVLGNGGFSDGKLQVPEPDLSFIAELQGRGLSLEYVNLENTAGIFKVTGPHRSS